MPSGKIKWFGHGKGVIERDNGQEIYFLSWGVKPGAADDLEEGQLVEFDIANGPKGPEAANVTPIGTTGKASSSSIYRSDNIVYASLIEMLVSSADEALSADNFVDAADYARTVLSKWPFQPDAQLRLDAAIKGLQKTDRQDRE